MGEKKFNLLTDVPYIHNTQELAMWLRPHYIVNDYLVDYDTYNEFLEKQMNILRACFTIKACREYPVKIKFNKEDRG